MRSFVFAVLAAGLLTLLIACNQRKQPAVPSVSPDDLPAPTRLNDAQAKPIHFLHKTFTVNKSVPFSIEVPPHSIIPRIHGTFQSFVPRPGDDDLSDESTDVTFLLMNAEQYADFARNPTGSTALLQCGSDSQSRGRVCVAAHERFADDVLRGVCSRAGRSPCEVRDR